MEDITCLPCWKNRETRCRRSTAAAVRAYTPTQPTETQIRDLLDAAVHAPTAMHLEPWAFVVVQDKALLKRYSDRAKELLLEDLRGDGDLARDAATKQHLMKKLGDPSFNIFYDAGTLVVICRKPLGPYAKADCWLTAENLMLAACEKGMGTCCIGFAVPVLNEPDVKQELHIPEDYRAIAPIVVGYPKTMVPAVARKPAEILHWVK
ncbi:MAG: nitroreductase family protein [Burkholderiales bacterium]